MFYIKYLDLHFNFLTIIAMLTTFIYFTSIGYFYSEFETLKFHFCFVSLIYMALMFITDYITHKSVIKGLDVKELSMMNMAYSVYNIITIISFSIALLGVLFIGNGVRALLIVALFTLLPNVLALINRKLNVI